MNQAIKKGFGSKILIYGAGAIGRGYLAPIFGGFGYEIFFVDKDPRIITEMKTRSSYKTAFSQNGDYVIRNVHYSGAFFPGEENKILHSVDFVFSCVGPLNFMKFAKKLKNVPTIISFENEAKSVEKIKKLSGNNNCYFGIPDVITSNTACQRLLEIDKLCLISENGELVIEKGNFVFPNEIFICRKEDLEKYWNCKFFLHNMPHAVAAFMGKAFGIKYLHEAMGVPMIKNIVFSAMDSMKKSMGIINMVEKDFMEKYAEKELKRFKDGLLFDPISRVGREPLRKLRYNDRLIQSAKLMNKIGVNTGAICLTIKLALYDSLKNYRPEIKKLGIPLTEKDILKKVSGLNEKDILFKRIVSMNVYEYFFCNSIKKINY